MTMEGFNFTVNAKHHAHPPFLHGSVQFWFSSNAVTYKYLMNVDKVGCRMPVAVVLMFQTS